MGPVVLAAVDLLAEDYMDDPEKFQQYRAERLMMIELMGCMKEDPKADQAIKEFKKSLVDDQVVDIENHLQLRSLI
jgi:hypothetical protein